MGKLDVMVGYRSGFDTFCFFKLENIQQRDEGYKIILCMIEKGLLPEGTIVFPPHKPTVNIREQLFVAIPPVSKPTVFTRKLIQGLASGLNVSVERSEKMSSQMYGWWADVFQAIRANPKLLDG